jgi:ATP-dependent Clp protease adaptor protein ClpS
MKEKEALLEEQANVLTDTLSLVLYNDDVNTFDHVIFCLMSICKMEALAAEQCTFIVHYSGKCVVKSGAYEVLEPLCVALMDKGLSAKIEA